MTHHNEQRTSIRQHFFRLLDLDLHCNTPKCTMKMKVLDFKQTSLNLTTMAVRISPEVGLNHGLTESGLSTIIGSKNRQVMVQVEIDGEAIEQKAY